MIVDADVLQVEESSKTAYHQCLGRGLANRTGTGTGAVRGAGTRERGA
jgi:hypothetical protein